MKRPFVEELRVQNYGPIQDATFKLTPLHALIGPNDSGKSTVLRALRTLALHMSPPGSLKIDDALRRAIASSGARGEVRFELASASTELRAEFDKSGRNRSQGALRGTLARAVLPRLVERRERTA